MPAKFQTTGLVVNESRHNLPNMIATLANVALFIAMLFFNFASTQTSIGLFKNSTSVISNNNEVDITPAGWTFSTWGIIYTWQAIWLVYNVVLLFLKNEYGPFYRNPPVLTLLFHIFITANFGFNIAWLFLFDSELFGVGFGFLLVITLSLYAALVLTHKNIYDAEQHLTRDKAKFLWMYRIFVNNGIAFYATWVTIATALNLSIAMTYEWGVNRSAASIVGVIFVAAVVFGYFILEIFVFEKYLRYTFSPYIQMLIAFSGVLAKNFPAKSPASIITLVLMIIAGLLFVTKVIVSVYRHKRK